MSRALLANEKISAPAMQAMQTFFPKTITEVTNAIAANKIVIIGMKQNPVVAKARKLLSANNLEYTYLEYGSYFSGWKKRLAIKLWSGWPTYPQVFIDGQLIGGCRELEVHIK